MTDWEVVHECVTTQRNLIEVYQKLTALPREHWDLEGRARQLAARVLSIPRPEQDNQSGEQSVDARRVRQALKAWEVRGEGDHFVARVFRDWLRLTECDCVPALVSSKSCRKCGRRATITQEHFMEIVRDANALAASRADAERLDEKVRLIADVEALLELDDDDLELVVLSLPLERREQLRRYLLGEKPAALAAPSAQEPT